MLLHQILITDNNDEPSPIIKSYMEKVKNHHPNATYVFYDSSRIRRILENQFNSEVLWAYDTLVPYSYKVDLAKYCLMWLYGGWYYDVGVYPEYSFYFNSDINGVFFTDSLDTSNGKWRIAASVMYSTPLRQPFMNAIERIIQNCKDEFYGDSALEPTSTELLGQVFPKSYLSHFSIILGEGKQMATPENMWRKALTFNDEVFSWYKEKGGDLGYLGIKGTNNYNYLWGNRLIYKK